MREVVKFHNDLNTVVMRNWSPLEMNIFFGIISKMRDKGNRKITFSIDELRELTDKKENRQAKRWTDSMIDVSKKINQLNYYYEDEDRYVVMSLFSMFEVNKKEHSLNIKVSEHFEYILNQLNANFTSYELKEFTNLRSSFSKTMYRLLKQWRTVGKKRFSVEEFYMLLDIPSSYSKGTVDRQVINKVINELSQYFKNLKVKKIQQNTRGNPITHYEFTWLPEKTEKWDPTKYNYRNNQRHAVEPDWLKKERENQKNSNSQNADDIDLETQKAIDEFHKKLKEYKDR